MSDHPDYRADDFSPPLSPDAALMLEFVQEKSRKYARLKAEFWALVGAAFLVGLTIGVHFGNLVYSS